MLIQTIATLNMISNPSFLRQVKQTDFVGINLYKLMTLCSTHLAERQNRLLHTYHHTSKMLLFFKILYTKFC
jgi:hypothetical protein